VNCTVPPIYNPMDLSLRSLITLTLHPYNSRIAPLHGQATPAPLPVGVVRACEDGGKNVLFPLLLKWHHAFIIVAFEVHTDWTATHEALVVWSLDGNGTCLDTFRSLAFCKSQHIDTKTFMSLNLPRIPK
jgi:hypothetical protein